MDETDAAEGGGGDEDGMEAEGNDGMAVKGDARMEAN